MLITRGDATARAALVICSSPILQVSDAGEAIIIHGDSLGFEERRPGVSSGKEEPNALEPGVRPAGSLVVVHTDCCASHFRAAGNARWPQSEAALVCDCGCLNGHRGGNRVFQNAGGFGGDELRLWRSLWAAEDCLDCPR